MCIRDRDGRFAADAGADPARPGRMREPRADGGERDRGGRACLLYTSDAADERSSVDLGGRRIINKKTKG